MSIELTIVTPEREVFHGPVDQVVLPGVEGDFGVLEHHERFLAPLRIGEARIEAGGRTRWAAISEGFARVTGDKVVVLADAAELAEEIDEARARRAHEIAERELTTLRASASEDDRFRLYETALERALIRMQVAGKRS